MCRVEPRIWQGIILLNQHPCIYIIFQCVAALIKAVLRIVDFWFILLVKTWPQGCHDPVTCVRAARGPARMGSVSSVSAVYSTVDTHWRASLPDGPKIGEQVLQIFLPLSHFLGVRVEA